MRTVCNKLAAVGLSQSLLPWELISNTVFRGKLSPLLVNWVTVITKRFLFSVLSHESSFTETGRTKLELHLAEGRLGAPERADGGGRGGENGSGLGAVSAQNRFQGTDLI